MPAVLSPTKQGTCKIPDALLERRELTVCSTLFYLHAKNYYKVHNKQIIVAKLQQEKFK